MTEANHNERFYTHEDGRLMARCPFNGCDLNAWVWCPECREDCPLAEEAKSILRNLARQPKPEFQEPELIRQGWSRGWHRE